MEGWKVKNDKPGYINVIEDISELAGDLSGKLVVIGKEIADCVRNMATETQESLNKVAKKTASGEDKKKSSKMAKKKTASKQAGLEEKSEKPEDSSCSPSRPKPKAGIKTNIAVKTQKRQSPATKEKTLDIKPSGPTAKN